MKKRQKLSDKKEIVVDNGACYEVAERKLLPRKLLTARPAERPRPAASDQPKRAGCRKEDPEALQGGEGRLVHQVGLELRRESGEDEVSRAMSERLRGRPLARPPDPPAGVRRTCELKAKDSALLRSVLSAISSERHTPHESCM